MLLRQNPLGFQWASVSDVCLRGKGVLLSPARVVASHGLLARKQLRRNVVSHTSPCAKCTVAASPRRARVLLPSARHTAALGRLLAADARAGDVICLRGDLGAGKTSLAQAYVRAARRDATLDVASPTYTLVHVYPPLTAQLHDDDACGGELPTIYHMDLWRVRDAAERALVDFEHVFAYNVSLIEWPDRLGALTPASRLEVWIQFDDETARPCHDTADSEVEGEHVDFWGFQEDDDDTQDAPFGRTALLLPVGEEWTERVQELSRALSEDEIYQSQPRSDIPDGIQLLMSYEDS